MSRGIRGIGLGLYLVRGFVTAMGGRIWVESEHGRARRSSSSCPRARRPRPRASAVRSPDAARASSSSTRAAIRLLCRVNLQADGFDVQEAPDGVAAMEIARAWHPELILLDVMMPGEDGFAVAERIRDDPQLAGTRVMFLTARADIGDNERARAPAPSVSDEAVQSLVAGRQGARRARPLASGS